MHFLELIAPSFYRGLSRPPSSFFFMYYPYLYTYTCTAVLFMLCLELCCTCLYGCAICRAYVGMYGCAVCRACVKMYGPAACAVLCTCMYGCAVYWACKDAYILWFAKVFSGLEPHPKQGPTMRTSMPSLYFGFKIDFFTLLEIVGGTPLTLSPYFNKKKGK